MDNLDQLQAKLDKILNPSMPEPVAIPEVKAQPINPMYYQIAAGMGNNDGAATMSEEEKDLRTLNPNQLIAKYGEENANYMLGNLARASGELQRGNLAERDWGETAWDSTTGIANAFVGGLGGIAAYGAGKVSPEAGVGLSNAVESLRRYTEENQSDALNARRKVGAIKDSLTQRDSDAQYDLDIKNGDSELVAGLSQIGRDITNSSVFNDRTLLAQGTADAIGSFLTAYPVAGAIKGAAKLLVPKATARGIGLSGAMDAELGKLTVNRALSNADKLVWPVTIGALESSGTYQQTSQDAINTLQQQGKSVGDNLDLINDTAQQAADRMFLPAAALGTITRFGEKPFSVPSLKQAGTNILGRELPEEAGQGALGTILSNQAIQDKIDPNRKLVQGVGEATVQGAVYGSLAAGTVQAPGLAKQSVISAAKATLGYVDKRTALAAEKADDASPVGTKALKEKASTLVPNAEPVKQTLAAELSGTDLTPEEKDQGIKYANDLVDSLRVSVENEFDDTIPTELSAITSGSEHRIDAIQQLAKKVITTSDPNDKLHTAATMYQLLQPILDLQTNRPSSVDSLSPESQAVLKDYESLIANVNNSPTIKNAMKQIHEIMVAQGATVISPVMEEELNTPAGKQKVQSIITAANIAPDQGNLDVTESIMKHAKEGKLNLTPKQTTTLNASVALLRARKELEEKNKQFGLNATDIVSSEILTDRGVKDNNARSATQYTQEILSAVRRGNTLGAAQLLNDMGLFVKHMRNKVEAINKHYLNGNPKAAPVPYDALLPTTHQWVRSDTNPKAIHKGGFVNTLNPGSIKFVQGVELEHKILADVYNSLTEVFPDLGIDRIEPIQLVQGISSASIVSNTGSNNNTPPPSNVPPVVTPATPTGDGNNVPTPVSKRVKGHRAHIEVDGKHTYELTDSDVTYHYVWDTDNNELRVYSIRLTRDKETNKVIDHRLAAVDPITGSTFALLSGGNKDILITPESVLSSVIAGGVTVQGYAQNPGKLTQEQRDKTNTDLTSKAIKKRIAIEEESIAMFAEMGITTGPQIDKINARIKELKALLNSVPLTPASTPPVEAEIKTTPATWSNQDTDLPVDVFVDDNGTPISENGYTKVRYTAPDGKVTINYLPTTEITLDSDNDKRIKQLQDKASKSTLEELERIFKAVQVKITNKDSTTRIKEISDVYGSEITKRVAEMKEKDFMIKYTALRGSVAKGNTEDSPLLAIYDERFQKDLEEGTAAKANEEEAKVSTDISSNAKGLAGALTNPTELAKSKGNITESYPIEYGGKTYKDAEAVFQAIKDPTEGRTKPAREVSNNYSLMVAILKAKLKQYPALVAGITKQGGSKWILAATHQPTSKNTVWETGGENWFILALNEAYLSQVEPSKKETKIEPVIFKGKMTFAYGSNKRSDVESDTTFDAIKAGERTATTRYTTDGKIDYWSKAKVGDIIEFSNKDGDIVRVEVTKPLTKLPLNTDGETWSKKEGWSVDYFNKNVKPKLDKAYQLEYKLIGKAEPKKATSVTDLKDAPVKQEPIPVEPVVAKEVPVKQEQPVIDTTLDNELPTENTAVVDNSPIVTGNKNAVIKVKSDVVVPSKFSKLVQGIKNFFINSFKFKGDETTRTDSVESPLQFVKDALLDNSLFQEAVPNSNYEMNKTVAKAYRGYLGQYYDELSNTLAKNLQDFLTVPNKKGVIRLDRINKGDPLHRYAEGKVLNLTEKVGDTYKYNQHLLELATLAGLQWFLTAGQTERRLEAREISKLTGIPEGKLSNSLIDSILNTSDTGQLSQGLTNTIKSFWGVSGINTEMMAYTDGIAEAMAAEILRAFEELGMITKTSIYIDKATNQQLIPDPNHYLTLQNQENDEETAKTLKTIIRLEVNRFDNDALYSFPTAIQEVVLVESEDVTYFGDDIPPVPQTQLGDTTIKLSRKEKKAIAAANKTEVKTNVLQANVIMSLSQDALKVMFGGGIENENMNKNTLAAIQGKNKTVLNAYQAMVDMLSKVDNVSKTLGKDAGEVVMRFPHTITAVGRLMMLGKYNIQSSKLLREVFLPTWSTLDLQDNQDHIDAFHLAVSQALGIKVHNEGPNSINQLRVLLSEDLSDAITLVQEWMEATDNGENPIEFDGIKLAQIFKDAKEGLTPNAFHALVEYVRYQRTEDKTKFTTGLYLEADGVTNGPGNAIQMLTLGRFTGNWVTTVEKIGHSFAEPKAKHELDKNNPDLYKTGGINSVKHSQAVITKIKQSRDKQEIMQILGSLYSLLSMNVKGITYDPSKLEETGGVLANRDFFKNPLTILVYGSGIPGLAGKAARQMADNIYKRFSDANILLNSKEGKNLTVAQAMFPGDENAEQTYKKFVEDLNRIRGTTINTEYIDRKKVYVVEGVTQPDRKYIKSELQKFTFSDSEIDAITQNITKGLVEAMYQGAIETVGHSVMQSTQMIQMATQIQSILLEAAFTKAVQDKIASHIATAKDTGYINGDFISKQDFMDIMEELKVIAPYLKTPDQTFLAAKSGRYRNEKNKPIGYSLSLNSKYRTDPNMYIPTNAGVSGTPNLVIGMGDAYAILQAAIDESLVGNLWIYDGINMPLDKITDYAPKLNKAAFEAWQNNPLRVIEESFRSFMGEKSIMIKALNETLNNEDLANQLNKSLRLYKEEDKLVRGSTDYALSIFNDLLNELKDSADSIDARHAAIARMPNSVDQLAAAGVPYHNGITVDPTLDTPEKIAEQLNKYYQEELDKIKNKPKAEPVKEMTPEEMDPITKDMLSNTVTDISSGVKILYAAGLLNLGKSINLSREQRKAYIQLVRSNKLDGYKVVFGSIEQIKKYRELYGYKFVDLDQETDNGFIDMNNKIIHLINPSVETLVHEMIHAATYGSVLNYYQNPSLNTKEVNEAIERTEKLKDEFLKLSPKELARLTSDQRTAINNVKAAMQEPATNFDNSTAQIEAKALNEFMAWSLSNQQLIAAFKNVQLPKYLRIAQEVIAIIKKFFTFKDKVTGETKEQDLTIPKDLFGNLLFNASIIINSVQPSLAETIVETTLFHSGTAKHITELRNTLLDKVVLFLNNTGQPMNISLYNSGFGKTLTEAYDTVSSLTPIFGISGVEETTLNYVVAALSTEIQIDPLTIDGIQTLYGHAVVELAKQVDAGTYPKAKYDALIGRIGNHKNIGGKSTLLPVFLGLGLIDTELRDALAKIDMPTKAKNTTGTLDAGLDNFFNKMLDGLFKALTGQRKANNVADALELLTERLTEIALKESRAINSPFNAPGNNADKANEWVSNNISKLGDKGLALGAKLETSNKLRVKQLGSAITILSSLASETNGETVSRAAISIVNKTNAWKPFREFITDLTNRTESNALVYDLIKKVRAAVQQLRQNYRTEVPKKIAKKFTRVLSNDEWSNLFRSMAKTDLAALIDIMSKEEILDLFTNPNSLNKQISSLENRIQNQDTTNWSLYQTKMKQLSVYMNTGVTGSNFLRNPYAIHGLLNEAKPKNFKVMGKDAVHSIDQLTTLYAIEGLSQQDKTDMAEMIKEESEALGFIIDYLVGQSAGEVLKAANNPVIQLNYYKGHIPQINKSGSSLLVATDDQMHNLKLRGYTRIADYAGSNIDPNRIDKGYYFSTVSGNTAVSQGTIQNIQKTISGVDDTYGFTVGSMVDRITDPAEVRRITLRLSKETNTVENLMPIFAASGEVIAYERSMNPEMIAMLKPSEHLAEMIGVWRGRQIEEQIATEINKEVIDNHYTMWKNDIAKSPSSQKEYVNILDPKQLDVIEQDMVSLFSFETRQYIANTYGSEFWVRKDVMNDMIGFRKASIADVFTGKTRLSKETQEVIKKVLVTAFGYKAYKYAVNSEKFIQNVTNEVRTLIIVKSLIVPMFNIASNIVQAIARGVPIKTIAKAPTKILELRSYTQSQVKQVGLEAELRAASGNPSQQKVLEAQIQAIKDGHKRLSIWPLIEAGEFSTISDIGSNSEDIDLFSGNSENWLRNKIDKLPPALKTTVRYGFMTRDTALFQGLQKMVQYGDFIAKAVMYDDLMKRKGLTKEQALGKITDEFVNYDKLPGRARGYLEDMGLLWFYNYKLRITKIALSMVRNNPLHLLLAHAMPIPLGAGIATEDNFITKLLDGSLTRSIGPGMVVGAPLLNPWYNAMN